MSLKTKNEVGTSPGAKNLYTHDRRIHQLRLNEITKPEVGQPSGNEEPQVNVFDVNSGIPQLKSNELNKNSDSDAGKRYGYGTPVGRRTPDDLQEGGAGGPSRRRRKANF